MKSSTGRNLFPRELERGDSALECDSEKPFGFTMHQDNEEFTDAGRSFFNCRNKSTQFELFEILEYIQVDADACICTSLALP